MASSGETQTSCYCDRLHEHYSKSTKTEILLGAPFEQITWIFSPGHAGVVGNERADVLVGATVIDNNLTLDPPTVLRCIQDHLALSRTQTSSYKLTLLKEKGVQAGMTSTTPAEEQRGADRTSSCLKPSANLH